MPKKNETQTFPTALPFLPDDRDLLSLKKAAARCTGCDLYQNATQTVFGQGPASARILMIGEQPGDQEDRVGEPFIGPAGRLLDQALVEAGIPREEVYVTNAVKHFKWVARGKRRLHDKPRRSEILACRPWLEAEIQAVHPRLIICLGASAAQSLMGPTFRITRERGQLLRTEWAEWVMATIHPSALLRIKEEQERRSAFVALVTDLKEAARALLSGA
jgi:uracil-DNA glycosylase